MFEGCHFLLKLWKPLSSDYIFENIHNHLNFNNIPASGYFSVPIKHWALITGNLQQVSLFRFWVCCLSFCWNPLMIHTGTFKLSWLPQLRFQRFWFFTSSIKTGHSTYLSSVGVLLKNCLNKWLCCWMEGV